MALRRIQAVASHLEMTPTSTGTCPARPGASYADLASVAPKNVVITGAAGQIAYSLLFQVATGRMLGPHQPMHLRLLDIPPMEEALKGVVMEVEDCAFPLVTGVLATSRPEEAFRDADIVLLVGAFPRKEGMERKDLLEKNCAIFREQGAALGVARAGVRVVVVGNPANTNAYVLLAAGRTLDPRHVTCLTRLDHNRAVAQVAAHLGVRTYDVTNVAIWGNHSATQYPDVAHAQVRRGARTEAVSVEATWLTSTFIPTVQQRGAAVIKARKLSSAASAANAIVEHVRDWVQGTPPGQWVSMGVCSDGSYGVPKGLIYSFPVTCKDGEWSIVQGLPISDLARTMMAKTQRELEDEAATATAFLNKK